MDLTHPICCLTFNLQRSARVLGRKLDAALKPVDLGAQQFAAIALLAGYDTLSTGKLAELICVERTTMTRNLAILKKKGLVEDSPNEDRRVKAFRLTEQGRQLFGEALPLWLAAQQDALAMLKTIEPTALLEVLQQLR